MIGFLKEWITNIIIAIVFGAFVDIVIPDSSMKKYVKLTLGLLIMAVILHPVLKLINNDFSISNISFQVQNKLDNIYLKNRVEYLDIQQSDQITKVYKENLERQMEQQINEEIKGMGAEVSVDVVEDAASKDYGKLKKINVMIKKNANEVAKVEKVKIGKTENSETGDETSDMDYSQIKRTLSSIYGIGMDSIEINTSS
ncbi:MAG TPA: stage III sporulation protein AF [Clostridiaceae bacterium]|nr:stage III sporulation protein AF [Clostridiaceae bacterium]